MRLVFPAREMGTEDEGERNFSPEFQRKSFGFLSILFVVRTGCSPSEGHHVAYEVRVSMRILMRSELVRRGEEEEGRVSG